jgi:hypothetical protein
VTFFHGKGALRDIGGIFYGPELPFFEVMIYGSTKASMLDFPSMVALKFTALIEHMQLMYASTAG